MTELGFESIVFGSLEISGKHRFEMTEMSEASHASGRRG